MSMVPLMFRDWWDDWDTTPFRSSRLLDQHFGTGLRRDDILSSLCSSPSLLRTGYIRPWRNQTLQRQDSGSTISVDNNKFQVRNADSIVDNSDKFQVILDVAQFSPNEITVKTTDKFIVVEGKHEEKQDEHGFVSRQFTRRYMIPAGIDSNDISSTLSSDGVLTVSAPRKQQLPLNSERVVPITQTGPNKQEEGQVKSP